MSQKRPWHTELSSLVVTLSTDQALAAETVRQIAEHEAITVEDAQGHYLPIAIEAVDARPIHQWLESLPGVVYVDVVFCSTEVENTEHEEWRPSAVAPVAPLDRAMADRKGSLLRMSAPLGADAAGSHETTSHNNLPSPQLNRPTHSPFLL